MATWNIDPVHSTIGFKARHLMISTVRGQFNEFEGTIEATDDTFGNTNAHFSARAASISTNNAYRDGHLQSAEFFEVEKYPTVTFSSRSFVKDPSTGSGQAGEKFKMVGDLTMHGITKEVTLDVAFNGIGVNMDGKRVASFDVAGKINRKDFGLLWNKTLETGGVALGDDITLDIHIEAVEA